MRFTKKTKKDVKSTVRVEKRDLTEAELERIAGGIRQGAIT